MNMSRVSLLLVGNACRPLGQADEQIKKPLLDFHPLIPSRCILLEDSSGGGGFTFLFPYPGMSQLQPEWGDAQTCDWAASFPKASRAHRNCSPGYCKFTSAPTGCLLSHLKAKLNKGKFHRNINQRMLRGNVFFLLPHKFWGNSQ